MLGKTGSWTVEIIKIQRCLQKTVLLDLHDGLTFNC